MASNLIVMTDPLNDIEEIRFEPLHQGLGLHPRPKIQLPTKLALRQNLKKETETREIPPHNMRTYIERATPLDRFKAFVFDVSFILLLQVFFIGILAAFVFFYKNILLSWEHLSLVKLELILLGCVLSIGYFSFFDAFGGQTFGKRFFNIEVCWQSPLNPLRVFMRVLATPLFFLYRKHTYFHDRLSGSYVRKTTLV